MKIGVFLLIFAVAGATAQTTSVRPEWFLYQKGLEFFRAGDFGNALRQMKELADAYGETAESNFLLGRIYEQEGEAGLAEKYYSLALEKSGSLNVPQDRYVILFRIAEINLQRKNYKKYEDVLETILADQEMYSAPRFTRLRDSYLSTALHEGFDSLANLYRIDDDFARKAHTELGILHTRTGRSSRAVLHLVFANLAVVSTLADELRHIDPSYRFSTLKDALQRIAKRPELLAYLETNEVFRSLYFLGSALFQSGSFAEAKKIWSLVSEFGDGEWKIRSRNQIIAPQPEPLIAY